MEQVKLIPLQGNDREQFILDNQEAFRYGALEEFGLRDDHFEEDGEIISRRTIESAIDSGEAYHIVRDGKPVGGVVIHTEGTHGELDLLFAAPQEHSKGIGYAAWCEVEKLHPEVTVWETVTPYFEKRNIHFYVNRCGFHIVEFYNSRHPDLHESDAVSDAMDEQFPDGMFRFEKRLKQQPEYYDGGIQMDMTAFHWTHQPKNCVMQENRVEITTMPHTDLWQRTYYHFRNDNAPVFQMETDERYFSFVVKTSFDSSSHRFDQCGIVLYLDSENWLKGSIEYENGEFQHLGSVVTNHGWSDWATTEIPASIKSMWYRLSRREDDYRIECSEDGVNFHQMRICHLHEGDKKIRFGIYACSPEDSSFTAVFTDTGQ